MKMISPKIHGVIDYTVVAFLWLSPLLFSFTDLVSILTYGLGFIHLMLTVFSDFPLGLYKILPFKFHGIAELIVSIILIASTLFINLSEVEQIFYFFFGIAVFFTWLLTDYNMKHDDSTYILK